MDYVRNVRQQDPLVLRESPYLTTCFVVYSVCLLYCKDCRPPADGRTVESWPCVSYARLWSFVRG